MKEFCETSMLSTLLKDEEIKLHTGNDWRICYSAFSKMLNGSKEFSDEVLSLKLGNYLAGWGMYRGSSFLPKFDQRIHLAIPEIVRSSKHQLIRDAPLAYQDETIDAILSFCSDIRAHYATYSMSLEPKKYVSDTLVTKIALATLACMPAFDRFFREGYSGLSKNSPATISRKSLAQLSQWARTKKTYVSNVQSFMNERDAGFDVPLSCAYPSWKIVDLLCFMSADSNSENNPQHKEAS